MTKVFITIPWFVPAYRAGGPIQSVANLVNEFYEETTYYIFCGDTDLNGGIIENIETGKWIWYNDHSQVWYAAPEKLSDTLIKQVETIKPDILYIIGIFSWHFNMVPMLFCKVPKKILSARGMLHPGALAQKKWKKKIYLKIFKLLEYHYKIIFHATDSHEEIYIRKIFGKPAKINIAGNFPKNIGQLPLEKKKPGILTLVSIALISPMKNILIVLESLRKMKSSIQYKIYGPVKDSEYWNKCVEEIKLMPDNIQVKFYNEIHPSKINEALLNTHVFILPSESENFGHAIYEALSAGRPVITSNYTPWDNLKKFSAGINVSLENNDELTEAINFFASMNETELLQWHAGAIAYAANAIDIKKIKDQFRKMFAKDTVQLSLEKV